MPIGDHTFQTNISWFPVECSECAKKTAEIERMKKCLAAMTAERDEYHRLREQAFLDRNVAIRDLNDLKRQMMVRLPGQFLPAGYGCSCPMCQSLKTQGHGHDVTSLVPNHSESSNVPLRKQLETAEQERDAARQQVQVEQSYSKDLRKRNEHLETMFQRYRSEIEGRAIAIDELRKERDALKESDKRAAQQITMRSDQIRDLTEKLSQSERVRQSLSDENNRQVHEAIAYHLQSRRLTWLVRGLFALAAGSFWSSAFFGDPYFAPVMAGSVGVALVASLVRFCQETDHGSLESSK